MTTSTEGAGMDATGGALSTDQLTALAAAAEKATPGPWLAAVDPSTGAGWPTVVETVEGKGVCYDALHGPDAELVAAANPLVVAALVRDLTAARAENEGQRTRWRQMSDRIEAAEAERDAARAELADARRERDEVLYYVGASRYSDVEDMFGLDLGCRLWRLAASRSSSSSEPMRSEVSEIQNCRSEQGVVVGLIDGMIAQSRVVSAYLREHGETHLHIAEALADARSDEDINAVFASPVEPVRSGVAASSATCKSATEAVTEPETTVRPLPRGDVS